MNFLAALAILLHALLAGAFGPTPAPHGVMVSPAAPAPAHVSRPARGDASTRPDAVPSPAPAAAPTVAAPSLDPANTQLPTEVIGRAVTCPDGSTGYVVDVELHVSCPPAGTTVP